VSSNLAGRANNLSGLCDIGLQAVANLVA